MLYLVVGRTGSGKDYLASRFEKEGLTVIKSYTTRPKRTQNEDTHTFITKEEADAYTDKVATTVISGYEYFTTAQQVENSDVYIVDPRGVAELTQNLPDSVFHVIYVKANHLDRRLHAVERADNKLKEEDIFNKRDSDEDEQFTAFEKKLNDLADGVIDFPSNITAIHIYENDYDETTADERIKYYLYARKGHINMTKIISRCISLGLIQKNESDKLEIKKADGSIELVTEEHFADTVLGNDAAFADIMRNYISLADDI